VAAQFAEVDEKLGIDHHAAFRLGVELHHPALDAFRIELSVPWSIERIGEVDAPAVAAEFDHLRGAVQRSLRILRMSSLADDSTQVYRSGFSRVEGIGDIVLQELAGSPAGDI